ncbi:MAG: hypothetical protein A2496_17075 [Burkholderiales bacterium RIFOXYC12_FULL_60_6]|nr:MAG: hypothetical protein A2496_17075 [Burkholderiales bacterium RIFOXYC12_FULL_60_6]
MRQILGLEQCKISNHVSLGLFESIERYGVSHGAFEYAATDAANGIVHLPMPIIQSLCSDRVDCIEALPVLPKPFAKKTTAVRIFGQHVLAWGGM